ncbi:hypothetical protein T02_7201 [Trichinella nativa]|uniref:Uncharacterized protein n=1 Tax=Trichinella nativa TaxID=6335 RepID=A0A0V1L2F9_9BILA|nr:hypothetical protein T02_7201 [Trichinella nativa]
MKRADAVLNQVCSLTINHHKLSSGIPTGAAAYYHDVYAAHYNLRCFREKICITMPYYVCAITEGELS